ncbi:MAG TPA: cytochrome P450 [Candidatus Acidoferrales bacterium]|nr:cytochrome P450 [Candidatus Acidoferrales bacterium]
MSTHATPSDALPARAVLRAPGPPRAHGPLVFYRLMRHPLGLFEEAAARYGDVVFLPALWRRIFFINHPDYIRDLLVTSAHKFEKSPAIKSMKPVLGEGLLTSEREFHLRQRRLAQPAFHRQRVAAYGTVMAEFADRWRRRWSDGQRVDLHAEMMGLTLAVVGKTLFDYDLAVDSGQIAQSLETFLGMFRFMMMPFARSAERLPLPGMIRLRRARERVDAIVYRIIRERRASGRDHGDLLSMLLAAQDVEGDGGSMTDAQLRDEAITIILAGHETTSNALTWAFYLLSQHPEVEARLHAELDAALAGRLPAADDLPALPFTEMVLAETMRLYPPAYAVGRWALEDHAFGPYEIPRHSIVLTSQWVMHHDARFYPEPQRFDPGRWMPEARAARPKFAYFPFGGGNRVCIGEGFAWMEGILLLAALAQQWRMRVAPGYRPDLWPVITLRPRHGMPMTLEKRVTGARP